MLKAYNIIIHINLYPLLQKHQNLTINKITTYIRTYYINAMLYVLLLIPFK